MSIDFMYDFQLLHGDNVQVMRTLPNRCIDLIVCSPPYDDIRRYKGNSKYDFDGVAKEAYRVLKPGGVMVWVVMDQVKDFNESGTSFRQALYFQELGFKLQTLIYEKNGFPFPYVLYNRTHEYIFVLIKGAKPKTFNPIIDRVNSCAGAVAYNRGSEWQPDDTKKPRDRKNSKVIQPFGKRTSVWRYSSGSGKTCKDGTVHPALMIEDLAIDLIYSFSNPGDRVLDMFAGGGTTLKAAILLGRKAVGIEVVQEFCETIKKRIAGITDEEISRYMSAVAHLN